MNYQIVVYLLSFTFSVFAHTLQRGGIDGVHELCLTPNRTNGQCINIRNCPVLLHLLDYHPLPVHTAEYLQKSNCGYDDLDPLVCCEIENTTKSEWNLDYSTERPIDKYSTDSVTSDLLPTTNICGTFEGDRITGGKLADLNEFPWMALIEYQRPNGRDFHCGGVLISRRYVLTAAHCLKGNDLPKTWSLVSVRLGEYNTDTDPDCITILNHTTCAFPVGNIPVTEKIAHEDYDPDDISQLHDIALLRLERDVEFTVDVEPICLPTSEALKVKNYAGVNMTVAGWGKTEYSTKSNRKLKVKLPGKSNSDCVRLYGSAGLSIGIGQLCAGGIAGQDSCSGDSGGPLMTVEENSYYVAGIVSFGPKECGTQNWPGIYTRVSEYIPWIISKLRP